MIVDAADVSDIFREADVFGGEPGEIGGDVPGRPAGIIFRRLGQKDGETAARDAGGCRIFEIAGRFPYRFGNPLQQPIGEFVALFLIDLKKWTFVISRVTLSASF